MIEEEIPAALGGERLDRIVSLITDCSRSDAAALVAAGGAAIDGEVQHIGKLRVRTGQVVSVDPAMLPVTAPPAADDTVEFRVVHADEHLIIIDKPAGLVVHPAPGNQDGTLVNALLAHAGEELTGIGGEKRPGIVHRIDKDTSGLLVVAKTDKAHEGLAAQFADHSIERAYLAIVIGLPNPLSGTVRGNIGRSPTNRKKMALVEDERGKHAVTHYKTLEIFDGASLVECRLETGRTHQVRVHLAASGHALLGDPVYGRTHQRHHALLTQLHFNRQALHAAVLGFIHPITGAAVRFESTLPADMAGLLVELGNKS